MKFSFGIEVDCGLKADYGMTSAEAESDPSWLRCTANILHCALYYVVIYCTALAIYYAAHVIYHTGQEIYFTALAIYIALHCTPLNCRPHRTALHRKYYIDGVSLMSDLH